MNEYKGLTKKAYGVLLVNAVIQCLVFLIIVGGVLFAINEFTYLKYEFENYNLFIIIIFGIVTLLCVIYTAIVPKVRHRQYKYLIADDRIEIRDGIIFKHRTLVPIDRIHQIDVTRGPIDTRFGVAKVSITTAGGIAVFRFLEEDKANEIAGYLNSYIRKKYTGKNSEETD